MRLDQLLDGTPVRAVHGDASVEVTAVTFDSRAVQPGALHCCIPGAHHDGERFAADAVAAGAASLLLRHDVDLPVTRVLVDDPRAAMAPLSASLHGNPSRSLDVVGVTGTNGKTTTTHLIAHVLTAAGQRCSTLGTLSGGFSTITTPEAPFLQRALASARSRGDSAVALEVSSHALVRHRVDATDFAVAVFTGLSHDHLDEHGSMEAYFAAKARLFTDHPVGHAVIVVDDGWGARLAADVETAGRVPVSRVTLADWRNGWVLQLPGDHNRRNALCALAVGRCLGVTRPDAVEALASAPPVPGRMERIDAGQAFDAYVDYAHKPGALQAVLQAVRPPGGRVLVVFGCGGDRDRSKRAEMGRLAAALADVAIITTDNPRREDPMAIIGDVLAGIDDDPARAEVHVEPDRRRAIEMGVHLARPGDVLLVAGKGHELTQDIGDIRQPFDDRDEVRRAVSGRAS